ncbi:MAG: hypothetical protein ACRDVG_05090 [Jatrophihabitantaceae bacterium]
MDPDEIREAPPVVIGAVAAGVAPLPFLAVYAVLFIARGTVRPVIPPDVGNSKTTELVAGLIALALFVLGSLACYWLLDGRRRWPFLACQTGVLGASAYFLADSSTGSPGVPVVLVVTSVIALVLAVLPASWLHVQRDVPGWLRRRQRVADPAGAAEGPAAPAEGRIP